MSNLYIVTAKRPWYSTKPRTRYEPILVDAECLETMQSDFDLQELRSMLGKRCDKEPLIFIGTQRDLLIQVKGLNERDYAEAPEMSSIFQRETASYLDALVRSVPNPTLLFKRVLKRSIDKGAVELLGIRLARTRSSEYNNSDLDTEVVKPSEFLKRYKEKLHWMATMGLIPEVDPDLSPDDLAREFLFNLLAEELTLTRHTGLPKVVHTETVMQNRTAFGFNQLFGEKSYA